MTSHYNSLISAVLLSLVLAGCSRKLAPPTDLRAVALTDSTIELSWIGWSTGEEGFLVFESVEESKFALGFKVPQDERVTILDHRTPGTNYRYVVCAFAGQKRSKPTDTVSVTTPKTIPQAPTNLSGKALGTTSIKLSWDDNSICESGFSIERKNIITGEWEEIGRVWADWQEFDDTFRKTGTAYSYRVRAFNPTAASPYSNVCTVTTGENKSLKVVSPNGGEVYSREKMLIKWEADPEIIWVKVTIRNEEGIQVVPQKMMFVFNEMEAVGMDADNMTLMKWGQGEYLFEGVGNLPPSKTYKVRVTDLKSKRYDESDDYFEVK